MNITYFMQHRVIEQKAYFQRHLKLILAVSVPSPGMLTELRNSVNVSVGGEGERVEARYTPPPPPTKGH